MILQVLRTSSQGLELVPAKGLEAGLGADLRLIWTDPNWKSVFEKVPKREVKKLGFTSHLDDKEDNQ